MAIGGNLPKHLEVSAKTGVLHSPAREDMPYRRVAMEVVQDSKEGVFVDLGGMPIPSQNAKVVEDMIEKSKTVLPEDWYLTLHISQNAIDDDQTGTLEQRFKNVMPAFQRHINARVFTVLNAGDGTTIGTGVDALSLFNNSHIYPGARYQTAQDNLNALALSNTNFNTVWVAAQQFVDDQGNYNNFNYDLIVTHPTNAKAAAQIAENQEEADNTDRNLNPFAGKVGYITVPEFDTTAWVLVASGEPTKPVFVAIRKRPTLLNIWFDSQTGDGGMHYFQYHGRYTVDYGDWPTAVMGNS